jgi:archaellum biogenesis ATPase FlaH
VSLVARTVQNTSKIRYFSDITSKKVDWLWYPYIAYGKICLVQGDPGEGKTTFVLNIASLLSNGIALPESYNEAETPKNIIYQSAEDGLEDTIKPRLQNAGADCSKIAFIDDTDLPLTLNDNRLETAIRQCDAKLLVLDPIQAYIGIDAEMSRANDMRPLFKQLGKIAERTRCAIIIIGHMNKAASSKSLYRGLGSIDISAAARSILLVGRVKDEPTIRVMTQIKNSLAPEGQSIAFEMNETSGFRWIGYYDVSADDLLGGIKQIPDTKLAQAETLLRERLSEVEQPCGVIYNEAQRLGIGKRTMESAKQHLGIKSIKKIDGWYWSFKGIDND